LGDWWGRALAGGRDINERKKLEKTVRPSVLGGKKGESFEGRAWKSKRGGKTVYLLTARKGEAEGELGGGAFWGGDRSGWVVSGDGGGGKKG